jgi:hypothetical protein
VGIPLAKCNNGNNNVYMQIDDTCEVYITDSVGIKVWTTGTYLPLVSDGQGEEGL